MKKTITLLLSALLLIPCLCLAACKAGPAGSAGSAGTAGKSAYEIWKEAGHTGSEAEFLESLKGNEAIFNATAAYAENAQQLRDALRSKRPYVVIKNDITDFSEEWGIEGTKTDKTIIGGGHTVNAAFHVSLGARLKVFDLNIQPSVTAEADNPHKAGVVVAEDAAIEFYNVRIEMPASLAATYGLYIADTAGEAFLEGVRVFNQNTSGYAMWTSSEDVRFLGGEYGSKSTYTIGFGNTLTVTQIKKMFIVVPTFAAKEAGQFDLLVLNKFVSGESYHKMNIEDLMA